MFHIEAAATTPVAAIVPAIMEAVEWDDLDIFLFGCADLPSWRETEKIVCVFVDFTQNENNLRMNLQLSGANSVHVTSRRFRKKSSVRSTLWFSDSTEKPPGSLAVVRGFWPTSNQTNLDFGEPWQ